MPRATSPSGVWADYRAGRLDEAGSLLVRTWWFIDGLYDSQVGRVALRLFERVGFWTDDPDGWQELPAERVVYRAGPRGPSWSIDRETVEYLARFHELEPLRTGRVARGDVLAYITERGEHEVVVRPERVRK
jgi:hypothetical protein